MPVNSQELNLIPKETNELLSRLIDRGYEAYIVGGCLRDMLMGRSPHDFDICTNATPDETAAVFSCDHTVLEVGKSFGTVIVIHRGKQFEITTYRIDGEYSNNRRPDTVEYTLDITKDLARRDFTMNAMAYCPMNDSFVDPFGGASDVERGLIKCVGEPKERFSEDGLRIMRALRFSAQLGFRIEERTAQAARQLRRLLTNISNERIQSELCKILLSDGCGAQVFREYAEIFAVIIPEIQPMFGFNQHNPHHIHDVWEHTLHAMSEPVKGFRPDLITRLALLFHDIGKPNCFTLSEDGIGHFYSHAKISADICREVLTRLKFSNEIIENVVWLVLKHDMVLLENKAFIKRLLNKVGSEQVKRLIEIHTHDTAGQAPYLYNERINNVWNVMSIYNEVLRDGECFSLKELAINGSDIMSFGIPAGREVGRLLNLSLSKVIEGEVANNKDDLLGLIKAMIGKKEC